MTSAIDAGLGFYRDVLALRGYRQEVLAADIANANTPGFKAVDLDFKEALNNAMTSGSPKAGQPAAARSWQVSDARHLPAAPDASLPDAAASVKYQADTQVTLDGNSVDLNKTKLMPADNAVSYAAALSYTTQTIRMLSAAIGGSGAAASSGG